MSGGAYDYDQHRIQGIVEHIEDVLDKAKNNVVDDWGYRYEYSNETLEEFEEGIAILKKAYIYAQRIDWLLSGDDGEDSFHKRLREELEDLGKEKESHGKTT